ncbi:phosphatase domain-containing putative toxin [Burkholderia cepacia]|uniref:phosphatase domain-containing putative toxin n=1 Tax=Burkholderia cepacia TaxID=292 RepID=UPI001ABB40D2|nr:hypothetical protein [Burkholderia cepacia]
MQQRFTASDPHEDNGPLAALGRMRAPCARDDIGKYRRNHDATTDNKAPPDASQTDASRAFPMVTVPRKIENQAKPILVYDFVSPSRLRSTDSDSSDLVAINREGLEKIGMSGTEQFSEAQLDSIIHRVHPKIVVVLDTRQESHGFVEGRPVSWMALDNRNWGNVDKATGEILPKESKKLDKFAARFDGASLHIPYGSMAKKKSSLPPILVNVQRDNVESEQKLVERKGCVYFRIPIPDHAAPDLEAMDHLSDHVRTLVREKGLDNLHFVVHCRGGMGRTTLVMSALDMLVNAREVSSHDIIARQVKLRRRAESSIHAPGKEYKKEFRKEKEEVLQAFHRYAAANPVSAPGAISLKTWAAAESSTGNPVVRAGAKSDDTAN